MKTWAGRTSVDDEKISRRLELVRNIRTVTDKSHRRFRIGVADNMFAEPSSPAVNQEGRTVETPLRIDERSKTGPQIEISRTELVVGLAAIAGLTLGYLIGRRMK